MEQQAGGAASVGFEIRRRFRAPRETVFRAWTKPEVLRRWWFPLGWVADAVVLDLRVGGAYRVCMRRPGGRGLVSVRGYFLEVRPPELLKFTWGWEGAFESMPETVVTLELLEFGALTELILRHDGFADRETGRQHRTGWVAACERLDRSAAASR